MRQAGLEAPERQVFAEAGVDVEALRDFLRRQDLALVISRNVTARDLADRQQPFNLRVADANTQTAAAEGKIYEVAHLQFFQGDMIRGYNQSAGRRVLAQPMHTGIEANLANASGPEGSVAIADDGSMAAFVPARRAMSWQLTDPAGQPVVRERYWVTFQPGEIRTLQWLSRGQYYRPDRARGPAESTLSPPAIACLLPRARRGNRCCERNGSAPAFRGCPARQLPQSF